MKITEVRIKLMDDADDRLRAFCSVTFDNAFVVRDLKIIEGTSGPFVAMPSRKLTAHCPVCRCKNYLRAAYCNQCGTRLKDDLVLRDETGRVKLYADIAHPINSQCREMIQERVVADFRAELERSKLPGYVSRYDEVYDYEEAASMAAARAGGVDAGRPSTTVRDDITQAQPTTHVQPAEAGPRPPHRPPVGPASDKSLTPGQRSDDDFGAGIL